VTNQEEARPRFLTLQETADLQGRSTKSIRRAIASGDLPAFRIKGSPAIRIKASDALAMMRPIPNGSVGHEE
jgi:hypothetical protein